MKKTLVSLLALCTLLSTSLNAAAAQGAESENTARIHYTRPDGAYDGWQLYVWEDTTEEVTWEDSLEPSGSDDYGVYWDVGLQPNAQTLNFIIHKGDEKDPGPDMSLALDEKREVWLISGNATLYAEQPSGEEVTAPAGDLTKAQAHWLRRGTLALDTSNLGEDAQFSLVVAPNAGLDLENLEASETFALTLNQDGLSEEVRADFPYLADFAALSLSEAAQARAPELLRGQLALVVRDAQGDLLDATGVQIPGVLDDLYAEAAYDEPLGVVWEDGVPTVRVWAPTAQNVKLHLFAASPTGPEGEAGQVLELTYDDTTGIWSATGGTSWNEQYYLFETTVYAPTTQQIETNLVTDPYSHSLALNSTHSQIVNLDSDALQPEGWTALKKPPLTSTRDSSVYELHMRDFSVGDERVPEDERGTYLAFTHPDSNGVTHLKSLADAGLTHLHLLPTFDIATINEDKSAWQEPAGDLSSYGPASEEQQAAVGAVREQDPFNWGYDPYHYTVPEGSYATELMGTPRIRQYREMVGALNEAGLRVVMDVVYNHTNASGQDERSVLDKVVPGYYHRLNLDGAVETSTCCQNTATEHEMMEKLMVDSLLTWAKDYKVDGFRFDLMGHHMLSNMVAVKQALNALTLEEDGVDGANILLYGEGWNFGEVADNARGINATQLNVGGLGIATFNDRLRDAVRGGGPFDNGEDLIKNQGFINGLFYDPNAQVEASEAEQKDALLHAADQIRVGLTGNLSSYTFEDARGQEVSGAEIDYNGSPAGYTEAPQEVITYVSAHDNQTLWDNNQYKQPADLSMEERVRAQNMGLSIVALSQGTPFFHAGSELLRSKSLDRDSYDSGDWFNKLDFSYGNNNWAVGLPPAWSNEDNWPIMTPILQGRAQPESEDIERSAEHLREMLAIRQSSPLFRLESAEAVQNQLTFLNTGPEQIPGLIVMSLTGNDGPYSRILVAFNATDEVQTSDLPDFENAMQLHPVQQQSSDERVKEATLENGSLSVPARTTAVFVE